MNKQIGGIVHLRVVSFYVSSAKVIQMESHIVIIRSITRINHDVLQIYTDKPGDFSFTPGQGVRISINKEGWQTKERPFTVTNLQNDDHLQFIIKTYPERKGVTNELLHLKINDELILHEVFGTINYKGEGCFIAGGAGLTPFISILRYLKSRNEIGKNMLIFANKTRNDIILKFELYYLLGSKFINILSDEKAEGYAHGFITEKFLREAISDTSGYFYICGPQPMMDQVEIFLSAMGIDEQMIVKEKF